MFSLRIFPVLYASVRASTILISLALLCACSNERSIPPLESNATLLAFGDSLTAGVGAGPSKSYPEVLARLTGLRVVNAGVSGETAAGGRLRLASVLDKEQPSLLILMEGGNDILRNRSHEAIEQDLAAMIELAQERSIPIVLLGVPEKSLFSYSAPFYGELAERYELVFDGELIGRLMRNQDMKSDPIHFNEAGYEVVARSIYEVLQDSGAL